MSIQNYTVVLLLIVTCSPSLAQMERGFERFPDPAHPENFYIIPGSNPPLIRDDMPDDVRNTVLFIDSICKVMNPKECTEWVMGLHPTSVILLWSLINRIYNYDSFAWNIPFYTYTLRDGYKMTEWYFVTEISRMYEWKILGIDRRCRYQMDFYDPLLLFRGTPGIYRVFVPDVHTRLDPTFHRSEDTTVKRFIHWADVEVRHVFKGQHYYSSCFECNGEGTGPGCVRITWMTTSTDTPYWNNLEFREIHKGGEYLMFLVNAQGTGQNSNDYHVWHTRVKFAFELAGNYVLDPHEFMERGTRIPYDDVANFYEGYINYLNGHWQ